MPEPSTRPSKRWLTRGVLGIGLASLFSDWGHEAATAILPAFLASLGAPAVALGIIEGVSDGLSSFAKLMGGWIADRPRWRKPTGIVGYCATAITTFAYGFAHTWPFLLLVRALGWMGRGSRGPSRDSLLADSVTQGQEGRAFGFERAMDTLGAVLGPLCATLLVGTLGFRGVLRWTLLPGLLAAAAFALLAPHAKANSEQNATSFRAALANMSPAYWRYLAAVFTHGIGDFAPTLLILRATQLLAPRLGTGKAATVSIALYTLYNVVSAATSYPAGALGDRIGRRGLLALGYITAAIAYLGFIFIPASLPVLILLFGLAGVHAGFQQPLEKSLASSLLSVEQRGSGFGLLAAVNGIGDLVSSVVVGALWSNVSPSAGFAYAVVFIVAGAILVYKWV